MTDRKPYLLRAIYQWLIDNDCTPHIAVAFPNKGWVSGLPAGYGTEDLIVFNVSPTATPNLEMDNDYWYFSARFSGAQHDLCVDVRAILSVFSREDQEGMSFEVDEALLLKGAEHSPHPTPSMAEEKTDTPKQDEKKTSTSHLKIVRKN